MAQRAAPVDVVVIGMGWTGSILAHGLAEAGLRVLGLERGEHRMTVPNFQSPSMHDELKYDVRYALMVDPSIQTVTFRNSPDQVALPMRKLGSFLPGAGLGGAGVHWNGQNWRFLPWDFRTRSASIERYGAGVLGDLTVQDWPVTYEELEPFYDRWEYLCGIGGNAGNLQGQILPGGNPFEGPRARPFPNPPMKQSYAGALFEAAALAHGNQPFPQPSANTTRAYTNPLGNQLRPCNYCGYCERFACEHFAKASPQVTVLPSLLGRENFTLRTRAHVLRILYDPGAKRATGVVYLDERGQETEQPAELVLCCAFSIWNVHLLLLSGIGQPYDPSTGEGVVGRNYTYQTMSGVDVFMPESVRINPFMGAGALGTIIDDYNGDNFDHSGLGFIGGGYVGVHITGGRPIGQHRVPEGAGDWGLQWKRALARYYNHAFGISAHGGSMAIATNYLSLDPTYTNAYGQPLLRMTFDFAENDRKMSAYLTERAAEIARLVPQVEQIRINGLAEHYDITPYQTTHNTGGAIMGDQPNTSAVNQFLQHWDAHNLFVLGASAFPQNAGYNPTGTVAALAFRALDVIRDRYLPSPGPLVPA